MPPAILTQAARIEVPGTQSCGEVEPVLIGIDGALYLGIGSDHTARDLEREDIATSKRACPKPVGPNVVRVDALGPAFDAIALESSIDGEPYQRGTFAQMMPLTALLEGFRARVPAKKFVLSCGTVPLLGHGFKFGTTFSARISGGPLPKELTLQYSIAPKN
jgi:4-hydroxyphenylacetate 3-monooxygenase